MVVEIRPEMEDLHSQNWEILGDLIQKNVGKTMSFLPPMTGNGKHSTYIFMVMTGGWFILFPTLV